MTKWFRWPGLAGFVVIVGLIVGFWVLFADSLVKNLIEEQGSDMVGAKVELDGCDVSFMPMGLTLTGLQVTDPDNPMHNGVEISRLTMAVASAPLLQRKVIIDEMTVIGVRFDTPRKSSGVLPVKEEQEEQQEEQPEKEGKDFSMPSLNLPDVKTVLAKETLTSITKAQEFEARLKEDEAIWRKRLAELLDKQKIADYEARLKKLKGKRGVAGLVAGAKELDKMQRQIKADINNIKKAQADFSTRSKAIKKELADLKKAPQQDIQRLTSKYSPDSGGLGNVSSLIFGEQVGSYTRTGLDWYEQIQTRLEQSRAKDGGPEAVKPLRGKGVQVKFTEYQPLPDFLVRRIAASVELTNGTFSGTILNLTTDQEVLGQPMTLQFNGDRLSGVRALELTASLNHVEPKNPHDQLALNITGYEVRELVLSDSDSLPIRLESANADLTVRAGVKGRDLDATLEAIIQDTRFTTNASDADTLKQSMQAALADVRQTNVTGKLKGTLDDHKLSLRSDLDKVLQQAVNKAIKQLANRFAAELKEEINTKFKESLAKATKASGSFDQLGGELGQRLKLGEKLPH